MSNQLIRLANGQLGILTSSNDKKHTFTVPQADHTSLTIELNVKDVDSSKPLWKEIIPYRKLIDNVSPSD